ncbi:ParB/RepB/Spo0J family partition protein [Blautia wexlerae]|uniref:ParB/RepB/Spo0J family partition protein n=1 Tax=Blautia wexlerae TaxID=418240 RepID=UPI0034A41B23
MAFNLADMVAKRPKQIQEENSSDTVYRDVFKLIPSKANFYGVKPEKLQGLKNSILLFGVMQDVLIEERDGEDYIISGHCRTMCCRMLVEEGHEEFRKINCKYTKVKDNARKNLIEENCINGSATRENDDAISKLLERLSVIQANRFRDKSDWEKMREALDTEEIIKELKNLAGLKGKTRDIVRETIGVSGTQMERYHAVQKRLSAEWMAEFEAEKINITVARELADLDEKYQKQAMEHYMEHDIITQAEVRAFKKLQEDNRDIPRQFTLAQATGQQRPPENETPVQPELQIERLFEALNKGEKERVVKCDTRMAAYLISIRYRDVRIRNGHFNYQASKEGITFNPDSTMQYSLTWNELSEELVKRFGKKQKPVRIVSIDTPEKPQNSPKEQTETQEKDQGVRCIAGKSKSGICGSAYYCSAPYVCCVNCPEECNIRCGWIEKRCQTEADAPDKKQQKDHTGETTEMLKDNANSDLPVMRNNDQRKEWLRNYKSWGLWYEDKNIEVKYYKYDFDNGARLIVEEYTSDLGNNKSWWVSSTKESYYMHLVGGPEPDRAGGVPKWTYHTRYNKFPNSETELVEFLKEMQK